MSPWQLWGGLTGAEEPAVSMLAGAVPDQRASITDYCAEPDAAHGARGDYGREEAGADYAGEAEGANNESCGV